MSPHPFEELYDDYEEYAEEEPQAPPRHYRRPQWHSVPLRANVGKTQTTGSVQPTRVSPDPRYDQPHTRTAMTRVPEYEERRVAKSQLRYIDQNGNQVWQRGNQRMVFHEEPPPPARRKQRRERRFHWLFFVGLGLVLAMVLFVGWGNASAALAAHNLDAKYGYPRTWQTDAVVGHDDSRAHPSHFIFENLHGRILVTEYPGGDPSRFKIYGAGTVADGVPVTGRFADIKGDGKPEMFVDIGTDTPNTQTVIFANDGKEFVPPS